MFDKQLRSTFDYFSHMNRTLKAEDLSKVSKYLIRMRIFRDQVGDGARFVLKAHNFSFKKTGYYSLGMAKLFDSMIMAISISVLLLEPLVSLWAMP